MEDLFLKLKSENNQKFQQALETFVNNCASVTKFEFLDRENFRSQVWEAVFLHLENKEEKELIHEKCLAMLRILSRDKTNLDNILTKDKLDVILEYANLHCKQEKYIIKSVTNEAQKLLCNILFNSLKIQSIITETSCLDCVIDRISKYDENVQHDTKLFDVRIIFLITALNISTRNIVRNNLHGDIQLIKLLENTSKFCTDNREIKNDDATLICEILKALFNLFIQQKVPSTEEMGEYEKMTIILRNLLLNHDEKHRENLQSNIVNLLVDIPNDCYSKLIPPVSSDQTDIISYQDTDMSAIDVLVQFLNNKLDCKDNLIENLSPIFNSFVRMCKAERIIRKYVRMQVLPPLKDVMKRPEEGSTLRNKLCKLLTSQIIEVRDLAAEFLFVLCKEKVGRMIKYTGYGNAAGMFANKGLLGPDRLKTDYSSESEDSETEEYEKYKEQINPVIGCYEKPKPNPLEGMTEEQKEFEAMKLVSLVDKLQREGVIQPCRIGEDGKPKAIEHVLELEEHLPKQQILRRGSEESD